MQVYGSGRRSTLGTMQRSGRRVKLGPRAGGYAAAVRWRRCRSARDFELWAEAHREILPSDDLPGEHHARWLLRDGAEVAAICSAVLVDGGEAAFLSRAGVAEAWRGRGLQRAAIRLRERWARREGARMCVTYVLPANVPSMRSLVRCGYEPYEPQRAWAGRAMSYWLRRLRSRGAAGATLRA